MKLSLYYNEQMFFIKYDKSERKHEIVRITEENKNLVEGSTCLFEMSTGGLSLLTQVDGTPEQAINIFTQKMGGRTNIVYSLFSEDSTNQTIFGGLKSSLKLFFDQYKVASIVPLQYVLKKINPDGVTGIASENFSYLKEFRSSVPLNTDPSFSSVVAYNIAEAIISFNKTKEDIETNLEILLETSAKKDAYVFSEFSNLKVELQGQNIQYIDYGTLEEVVESCRVKIIDNISNFYKKKRNRRYTLLFDFVLIAVILVLGVNYLQKQLTEMSLNNSIKSLESREESLNKNLSDIEDQIPNIKFSDFDFPTTYATLQKYTTFLPEKIKYVIKGDTIKTTFLVDNAYLSETLINEMNEDKINYKYKKTSGYTFQFDIEEKLGKVTTFINKEKK